MIANLALIPARANSERCPGKNTADLGGKAVIEWTIKAAQDSAMFDLIAVTTNDLFVKDIAQKHGCLVIDRPEMLARPDSPTLPTVIHAIDRVECETVMLLQPTSPFRLPEDIKNAYDLLKSSGGDSVISVTKPAESVAFEVGHAARLRPCSNAVVENGAIYLSSSDHLMRGGTWYSGLAYAYVMPKDRSLDIDTIKDLTMARALIAKEAA